MPWLSPKPTNTRAEKSPNTEPSEVSKCVRVGRKTQFSQPANSIIIIPWNPHFHPQHMTKACNLWAPEEAEARRSFFYTKKKMSPILNKDISRQITQISNNREEERLVLSNTHPGRHCLVFLANPSTTPWHVKNPSTDSQPSRQH